MGHPSPEGQNALVIELMATIPTSLDDAKVSLEGKQRLLTATKWERAAIVATFVGPGLMSPAQFAALGISGLRTIETVNNLVTAWNSTGLPRPTPGQTVTLPSDAFPVSQTTVSAIGRNPNAVATALADPAFASKVLNRVAEVDTTTAQRIEAQAHVAIQKAVGNHVPTEVAPPVATPPAVVSVVTEDIAPRPKAPTVDYPDAVRPNQSMAIMEVLEWRMRDLETEVQGVLTPDQVNSISNRLQALAGRVPDVIAKMEIAHSANLMSAWANNDKNDTGVAR